MNPNIVRVVQTLMATDDYEVVSQDDTWAELIYVHNDPPHPVIRIQVGPGSLMMRQGRSMNDHDAQGRSRGRARHPAP